MKPCFTASASFTLIVLIACCLPAASADNATFNLKQARTEIEEVNRRFCEVLRKGDATKLASFFTEDGKSMGPNEPAHEGRKKIEAVYAGYIAEGATELTLTTTGIWGTAEMLAEEGLYIFATKAGKELDRGKYIVLWKKIGGHWLLFRDCYNSNLSLLPAK